MSLLIPSPNDETPSIMIASYPVYEKEYDDPIAAGEYDQIIAAVKASRSILDSYGIKEDAKSNPLVRYISPLVKIQVEGAALTKLFNGQLSSISALIGAKKLESISVVNDTKIEEGYAVAAVNSEVNVLLLVKVFLPGRLN